MDGHSSVPLDKETTIMFSTKTLLAAAALSVLTAAGIGSASAAPWEARHDRQEIRHDRQDLRHDRRELRHDRFAHRRYVEHARVRDVLRARHYSVVGDPYFVHDRYVVRTHDRFGRLVFVRIDPYSGAFLGEVRL
jgi:hypothetical protein